MVTPPQPAADEVAEHARTMLAQDAASATLGIELVEVAPGRSVADGKPIEPGATA